METTQAQKDIPNMEDISTSMITEKNYIPYDVYIKEHLKSNGIQFEDFTNLSPEDFKKKYTKERSVINTNAIETYKSEYKEHYLFAKKKYEEKMKHMNHQKNLRKEYLKTREEGMIKMIQSQTSYDYDTAKQLLIDRKHNYLEVIREYLSDRGENKSISNDETTENPSPNTLNQEIYSQIRTFMDDVNRQYEQRKQQKAILAEKIQRQQQQQQHINPIPQNEKIEDVENMKI